MQEFIYYNPVGLDFPISEHILVSTNIKDIKDEKFLISNSKEIPRVQIPSTYSGNPRYRGHT